MNAQLCLSSSAEEKDGLVYKTILREGTWRMTPDPMGRPMDKPLNVVRDGDDGISLEEVRKAFEDGAFQHVTVPTSHADHVDENTGFVRDLKVVEEDGRAALVAGIEFTDPEIKKKVLDGSIADSSAGLRFDRVRPRDGKRFKIAMAHLALTNKPWMDGLAPFVKLGEGETNVYELESTTSPGGEDVEKEKLELDLSEAQDHIQKLETELAERRQAEREQKIDTRIEELKGMGFAEAPGFLKKVRDIYLSDDQGAALMLSEEVDGKREQKLLSATDLVDQLIDAMPRKDGVVLLSEQVFGEMGMRSHVRPATNNEEENKDAKKRADEARDFLGLPSDTPQEVK